MTNIPNADANQNAARDNTHDNDLFTADVRLRALSEAVRAVTAELSLDRVLNRLAEITAQLVNARYAALGVPDAAGRMEQFYTFGMTERQIANMDHYPLGLGLLGALIKQQEPIRIEEMQTDPRSAGFCAYHPNMTSFLGVPIMSKGRHLGSLYLSDRKDGQPFSLADEQIVILLAGHAAVAIENARLSDQLQQLAVIEERDRISMELHDGIIQAIYAIGIKLELTRPKLEDRPEIQQQVMTAAQDLNHVIEDLRRYIQDLRVGLNNSVALLEQMDELAEGFRQVSSGRLVIDTQRGFAHLTGEMVHALVQVVRETLSNIVRHANASEVYVDLHENPAQITLVISDNGNGFDSTSLSHGNGLHNIRQRIRQFNGTVEIISQVGRGTTVTCTIPF
jgi:signal transduction histidine kinase